MSALIDIYFLPCDHPSPPHPPTCCNLVKGLGLFANQIYRRLLLIFLYMYTQSWAPTTEKSERQPAPEINSHYLTTDTRQPGSKENHLLQQHQTINSRHLTTDTRQSTTNNNYFRQLHQEQTPDKL